MWEVYDTLTGTVIAEYVYWRPAENRRKKEIEARGLLPNAIIVRPQKIIVHMSAYPKDERKAK